MARWYGAKLQVLHVMPPLPSAETGGLADATRTLTARNLQQTVDRLSLPDVDVTCDLVESAEPAARIVEYADACDADLIVTGSHGRAGVERVILGSVVETLLHTSRRPVLVVPSHIAPSRVARGISFSRMVCAVDFAAASLAATAYALSIAEEADAHLTLLHVIEVPPGLPRPDKAPDLDVARMRAEAEAGSLTRLRALVPEHAREYCTVRTAVLEGGAAGQILRLAAEQDAELIVLGVHGRTTFDLAIFGSTSKDVIRQAQCPVLVVPASRRARLRTAS
jgi:nucleotide-binding universal stress UspA family protein